MLYHLLRTKAKELFSHLCLDEKRKVKILCAPWLQKSSYHSLIIAASTFSPHPLVTVPRVSYIQSRQAAVPRVSYTPDRRLCPGSPTLQANVPLLKHSTHTEDSSFAFLNLKSVSRHTIQLC